MNRMISYRVSYLGFRRIRGDGMVVASRRRRLPSPSPSVWPGLSPIDPIIPFACGAAPNCSLAQCSAWCYLSLSLSGSCDLLLGCCCAYCLIHSSSSHHLKRNMRSDFSLFLFFLRFQVLQFLDSIAIQC